ncbi:DUF3558 domain-containing protein [Segniliparus rugosus]|uniref:Lipoprotein LprC n=1 Tax=Segniliparus rugosus (strain ATCC BAA-974 / DSM 45345 / CCUG 50838 / CIP 108380 / JCM 13579 / CDC 945) TaxID=679197 RepID=E5XU58_SEGRC|nr:DUF3558 domain-containing protein [Segniliparus rugosus]EFV12121.1 hypothetical protein HMPREF9336_03030 [Segniliparus rugosus ATCC BAA-974]
MTGLTRKGAKPGFAGGRLAAALALVAALVAGCGGNAGSAGPTNTTVRQQAADPYDNLMHECELLNQQEMLDALGMKSRASTFNGAVCRWSVFGGGEPLEVTFYWFETGNLDREKDTLDFLKYDNQWRDFDGQKGILAHPPGELSTCGAVANAESKGIIGWWVQPVFGSGGDSCDKAVKLMMKSLNTRT